ncbi:cytochrome c [Cytophagaceae bacterium DM2B3-1]|uniref:Cytochrome c n=1 Tax=Xanthocytophaga flava TaxID=3048013 RepID=A0ABT7CYX1_9BACT|nr:cytochrome c [Xanthocytophaga flavus]MDJ1498140.1 cytochrome c [Xanthocytophaga flavus]
MKSVRNGILAGIMGLASVCVMAQQKTPATTESPVVAGKRIYEQQCLTCHQVDGSGVPHLNPPLIKTSFVLGPKEKLVSILLNGLSGVEVEGDYYANPMPSFEFLTDQEIADVLTYIRSDFTNNADAVPAALVKSQRAAKK